MAVLLKPRRPSPLSVPAMDQRISLITLGVSDLKRARAFYEALGWRTNAKPDDDVVFFQAGPSVLALWDRAGLAEDSGVQDGGGWGGITPAHNVGSPWEVAHNPHWTLTEDGAVRLGPG